MNSNLASYLMRLVSVVKLFLIRKFAFFKIERQFKSSPIIVGGCARSGTTLMLAILDSHPQIRGIPFETNIFLNEDRYYPKRPLLLRWVNWINRIYFKNIQLCRIYQILRTKGYSSIERAWVEKTPGNINLINQLNYEFDSKVKFIHMVRDGRDVVLSKHPQDNTRYWVTKDRWIHDVGHGLECNNLQNLLLVKYEDLVTNYEKELLRILKFLDLDFHPDVLNYYRTSSIQSNSALRNGLEATYTKSIGKWRALNSGPSCDLMQDSDSINLLKRLKYL